MKKHISAAIILVALASTNAVAQVDTVVGRCERYFYTEWYDQCFLYSKDCDEEHSYVLSQSILSYHNSAYNNRILLNEHCANNRMAVKGIAAMVPTELDTNFVPSHMLPDTVTGKLPEYLMIFQGDSVVPLQDVGVRWPLAMTLLDSARWDTVAPLVMFLPMCSNVVASDSAAWLKVNVYEAYFSQPVIVDSIFYVGGTLRNNFCLNYGPYTHIPTMYAHVHEFNHLGDECYSCGSIRGLFCAEYPFEETTWTNGLWYNFSSPSANFGPFLPIVDFYELDASTDAPHEGTVSGSGRYPAMHRATVIATPSQGYAFYQWDDGNTDNPRTVEMTADTTLRAYFLAIDN